jgi:S-formylglutathione hydrolase
MNIEILKQNKTFGGSTNVYIHQSEITKTQMKFSTFLPVSEKIDSAIIWLSGLTCTEENFITKSGVQKFLKDTNTMIICPDTSPRGLDLKGEHDSYDFGSGAGFYLNATTEGYADHYKMYDYISIELVSILKDYFKVDKLSISGHSMGGHGALILGLREKELFKSVSAFSPIVNPTACAWGKKAFEGYLGSGIEDAKKYDATEILKNGNTRIDSILIDQGLNDEFYPEQLLTKNFENTSKEVGQELKVNYRDGYDHSFYFISTFIEEHIRFHLKHLSLI